MDFENRAHGRIYIGENFWITITDTLISTWIIGGLLILLAIVVRLKLKSFKDVPTGKFQNIVETLVETFENFAVGILTKKYAYFSGWFFGVFLFVLVSNISGIFGLRPPTLDFATVFPLAVTTVLLVQFMGLRHNMKGGAYIKDFFRPFPLFMPINLMGEVANSLSLSLRLFGNLLGGTIIMSLVFNALPTFFTFAVPGVLALYFDIFVGALHALIFVMLSMFFIMGKAPEEA